MTIHYTRGDLLQCNAEAIVNTINCVGVMGKGIALQFKQQYPNNFNAYQEACKANRVQIGKMFITAVNFSPYPRFIINFPTKLHWRDPSKLEYIEQGLIDLVAQIRRLGIGSIAIPALGCANGGLEWSRVKPMIEEAFLLLRDVEVYVYEPYIEILNRHRDVIPPNAIDIGRGYPLGNRFIIGVHGTRNEVIDMYRQWLRDQIIDRAPVILQALQDIGPGSSLLCYCRPSPCHGYVIKEFWTELYAYETFEEGLEHFTMKHINERIIKAEKDAFEHINIWSKGKTELGRLLSNFTYSPVKHHMYGEFASIEGFWYWLSTGKKYEELRSLYGFEAKKFGCKLKVIKIDNFYEKIRSMLDYKVQQNKHLKQLLISSELPFEHYYTYGSLDNYRVVLPNSREWIIQQWEDIRHKVKQEGFRLIIAGSRDLNDYTLVKEAFYNSGFSTMPLEIVSGGARGIDACGERLSKEELGKEPKIFKADWDGPHKKAAGIIRNHVMGDYADGLLAFHADKSTGTQDMIDYATKKGLVVEVITV